MAIPRGYALLTEPADTSDFVGSRMLEALHLQKDSLTGTFTQRYGFYHGGFAMEIGHHVDIPSLGVFFGSISPEDFFEIFGYKKSRDPFVSGPRPRFFGTCANQAPVPRGGAERIIIMMETREVVAGTSQKHVVFRAVLHTLRLLLSRVAKFW